MFLVYPTSRCVCVFSLPYILFVAVFAGYVVVQNGALGTDVVFARVIESRSSTTRGVLINHKQRLGLKP